MLKIKQLLLPDLEMERLYWPLAVGISYPLVIHLLGGLESKHITMASLCLLYYYNSTSRRFLKYFFPFMFAGIIYDSMRYYYWWGIEGNIHVVEPYELEKKIFGFMSNGKIVTPNEFFQTHIYKIFDIFCGFAYLVFVLEYLFSGFYLFFTNRLRLLRTMGWCFLLVNVMGFATYYIYPAAPPWYVAEYGLGPAQMHIHATASAASRFDLIFGTNFFGAMYGQSVDVYGAIPSLHVAYPLLTAWVWLMVKKLRVLAVGFYFLMCFSAIYLQHHYVIDIIIGTLYAVTAFLIVRLIEERKFLAGMTLKQKLSCLFCPTQHYVENQ